MAYDGEPQVFTDEEIRGLSDEKLIDQLMRAGGSSAGFSPYAETLKAEMAYRLRVVPSRHGSSGWSACSSSGQ